MCYQFLQSLFASHVIIFGLICLYTGGTVSLLRKGTGSDGLLSVIPATGVHIKSINVQDVSIRSCFLTGTGN